MEVKFEIPLKIDGSLGLNKIYSGKHWSKRNADAEYIHTLIHSTLIKNKIPLVMFSQPVDVTLFYNSKLDIDNHGYVSKLIIDGLKGYLIVDDKRAYVKSLKQEFWNGKTVLIVISDEPFKDNLKKIGDK